MIIKRYGRKLRAKSAHTLLGLEWKEMRRVAKFALHATIGFGVGGAIGGGVWTVLDAPQLGFAIFGAIGGASLGFPLKDWNRTLLLALAGAIGFSIGFLMGFFIVLIIWEPMHVEGLFLGAVGGTLGGASFGLVLRNWGKSVLLALAGAIGFGIAVQGVWDILRGLSPHVFWGVITLTIWGIVGGTFVGAALGYLEREKQTA